MGKGIHCVVFIFSPSPDGFALENSRGQSLTMTQTSETLREGVKVKFSYLFIGKRGASSQDMGRGQCACMCPAPQACC